MLDALLISGPPDFQKFQTKNNAYKNPEDDVRQMLFFL
jgi:hypothetical protein